jgi:hypothetical protein
MQVIVFCKALMHASRVLLFVGLYTQVPEIASTAEVRV